MKRLVFPTHFIPLIAIFTACGSATIEGEVFDNFNNPISGVTIKVDNTNIFTVSDSSGKFTLQVPGRELYNISFVKTGYTKASVSTGAARAGSTYRTPRTIIYKLPEEKGFYILSPSGYTPVNRVDIKKREKEKEGEKIVDYYVEGEPSIVEGPRLEFFNYQEESLALYKMKSDKSFFQINETKKQEWAIRMKTRIRDAGDKAKIHNVTFEYGDYIFAEKGEGPVGSSGFYLRFPAPEPEGE